MFPPGSEGGLGVENLLRGWTLDMERRNLSRSTIKKRRDVFAAVMRDLGDPRTLTTEQLERYLDGRKLAPRTRYGWISHLHSFYAWAHVRGYLPSDPTAVMARPRLDQLLPRPIHDDDLALALDMAPPMMRAWLTLMAYGGLRCAEVAGMERANVLDTHGSLRVLGKGRKERIVPMHRLVLDSLRAYGMARNGHLFLRDDMTPFPAQRVSRRVAVYFDELGIDATAHQLRHWFGTMIQAQCGDLRVTQELLGHASPSTSAGYAAFSNPKGIDAVGQLPVSLRRVA